MPKARNQEGECDISSCTRPGINNKPVFMETKMLKKLLDDIVAENIGGQLVHPQALFHPCIWPRSGEEKSWTQKTESQINITISANVPEHSLKFWSGNFSVSTLLYRLFPRPAL